MVGYTRLASMRWTVLYHKMQPYLHIDLGRVAEDFQRSKRPSTITKEIVAWHDAWMTVTNLPTVMSSVPG